MKIAYIIPSLAKSGPVNVVRYLIEQIYRDNDIQVYYFHDRSDRPKQVFPVLTEKISLREKKDFGAYDIVHSHGLLPDLYIAMNRKIITRAKTVTTLHNYMKEDLFYRYSPFKAYLMYQLWKYAVKKHDVRVCLSKHAVDYYHRLFPDKNIVYVYNGIPSSPPLEERVPHRSDIDIYSFEDKGYTRIGIIASAAGIKKHKGIDTMIKALPLLHGYKLYVAGALSENVENLKALADKLGVGDRIVFLGFCSKISQFISTMELMVVVSRTEGFSLALQEIIRMKKPVVCSGLPIFRELYNDNEVVFLSSASPENMRETILKAMEEGGKRIENAYKRFLTTYTDETMAEGYMRLYKEL